MNCYALSVAMDNALCICTQVAEVERLDQKLEEERSYTAKILDEVSQHLVTV